MIKGNLVNSSTTGAGSTTATVVAQEQACLFSSKPRHINPLSAGRPSIMMLETTREEVGGGGGKGPAAMTAARCGQREGRGLTRVCPVSYYDKAGANVSVQVARNKKRKRKAEKGEKHLD